MILEPPSRLFLSLLDNRPPPIAIVSYGHGVRYCLRHTCSLNEKREDVSRNEDSCQPLASNNEVDVAIHKLYYTTKLHVDRSCEQRRCDKRQHTVGDVWAKCPVWTLICRDDSSNVSYRLSYKL
jgi:hypothetical protein